MYIPAFTWVHKLWVLTGGMWLQMQVTETIFLHSVRDRVRCSDIQREPVRWFRRFIRASLGHLSVEFFRACGFRALWSGFIPHLSWRFGDVWVDHDPTWDVFRCQKAKEDCFASIWSQNSDYHNLLFTLSFWILASHTYHAKQKKDLSDVDASYLILFKQWFFLHYQRLKSLCLKKTSLEENRFFSALLAMRKKLLY